MEPNNVSNSGRRLYLFAFAVSMTGAALAMPYLGLRLSPTGIDSGRLFATGVAISAAAGLITNPVSVPLAKRYGPMSTFAVGVLLQGAGLAVVESFHQTASGVLVGFGVTGIGSGAAFGTATAALVGRFGRESLPGIFSAQGLLASLATGFAGVASSVLVGWGGRVVYSIFVWIAVVGYVLLSLVLGILAFKQKSNVASMENRGMRGGVLMGVRDSNFRVVLVLQFLVAGLVVSQLNRVYPLAWTAEGLDPALIGLLYTVNAATIITLQIPALRLSEKAGPTRGFIMGCTFAVISVTVTACFIHAAPIPAVLVGIILISVAEVCINATLQPIIVGASPPDRLVEYSANASLIYSLALVIVPGSSIWILSISPDVYWFGSSVMTIMLLLLAIYFYFKELRTS